MGIQVKVVKRNRVLEQFPQVYAEVTREMADLTVELAREIVPVDTGLLRSTIEHQGNGVVVADTYYAGYVEYGTRFMPPRPYLGPSAESALNAFPMIADDAFRRNMGG